MKTENLAGGGGRGWNLTAVKMFTFGDALQRLRLLVSQTLKSLWCDFENYYDLEEEILYNLGLKFFV